MVSSDFDMGYHRQFHRIRMVVGEYYFCGRSNIENSKKLYITTSLATGDPDFAKDFQGRFNIIWHTMIGPGYPMKLENFSISTEN